MHPYYYSHMRFRETAIYRQSNDATHVEKQACFTNVFSPLIGESWVNLCPRLQTLASIKITIWVYYYPTYPAIYSLRKSSTATIAICCDTWEFLSVALQEITHYSGGLSKEAKLSNRKSVMINTKQEFYP